MKERIQQDLKLALKGKKDLEVSVLRQLAAAILNREKEKRFTLLNSRKANLTGAEIGEGKDVQLTDEEIMEVAASEAKKRKEAASEYGRGGRQDLADKEKKELEILQRYLPEQLSEEELKTLVKEAVEKTGAKEMKDMGKVMAELMPKIKGRAEGSLVSKLVKDAFFND